MPGGLRAPAFPFPLSAVGRENAAREGQHTCNSSTATAQRLHMEGDGYGMGAEREKRSAGSHAGPQAAAGERLGGGGARPEAHLSARGLGGSRGSKGAGIRIYL